MPENAKGRAATRRPGALIERASFACSMRYGAFQTHFGGPGFRRAQQQPQQPQQPASPMAQLLQFVPIILLLLWTFMQMPSAPVSAPHSTALHRFAQAQHRNCSCMGNNLTERESLKRLAHLLLYPANYAAVEAIQCCEVSVLGLGRPFISAQLLTRTCNVGRRCTA